MRSEWRFEVRLQAQERSGRRISPSRQATTGRVLAKKRPPDIQKGNQQALGSQGCLR